MTLGPVVANVDYDAELISLDLGSTMPENGTPGERPSDLTKPNFGTLEIEMTIDDAASYTAPWTVTLNQPLVLDSELLDYYCLENEKDLIHMIKK